MAYSKRLTKSSSSKYRTKKDIPPYGVPLPIVGGWRKNWLIHPHHLGHRVDGSYSHYHPLPLAVSVPASFSFPVLFFFSRLPSVGPGFPWHSPLFTHTPVRQRPATHPSGRRHASVRLPQNLARILKGLALTEPLYFCSSFAQILAFANPTTKPPSSIAAFRSRFTRYPQQEVKKKQHPRVGRFPKHPAPSGIKEISPSRLVSFFSVLPVPEDLAITENLDMSGNRPQFLIPPFSDRIPR